ncbi:MAG: radical SAM protein [Defluviitaleaceae bacterium]|nr:radical SAM protein [Defluviitaleaceae bacterium]MCL2836009.1 radical SAM protein [Defluviitaleaceae bacterium]
MERYGVINNKIQREIVLLKGKPCAWGRCLFCDYTDDNTVCEHEALCVNTAALSQVRGMFGRLEVVNSGSVFELHGSTLDEIRKIVADKAISALFFESAWMYRGKIEQLRESFKPVDLMLKCGIETFDDNFRNNVMNKGIDFAHPREVAEYFDSVCLLVGLEGQTREMVARDIDILTTFFKMGCVNIFVENTTGIKSNSGLIEWFIATYGRMDNYPGIDVLWDNTDFGVGGTEDEK